LGRGGHQLDGPGSDGEERPAQNRGGVAKPGWKSDGANLPFDRYAEPIRVYFAPSDWVFVIELLPNFNDRGESLLVHIHDGRVSLRYVVIPGHPVTVIQPPDAPCLAHPPILIGGYQAPRSQNHYRSTPPMERRTCSK